MSMNLRQTKKAMPPNSYSKKNQTLKESKDDDKSSQSNENLSEIHSNQVSNSSADNDGRGRLNKRNNPNNFKGRYSKMNSGKYLYKDNNKTDKKPVINKKKHLKVFNNEFVNTLKKFFNKLYRKEAMLNKKRNRESIKDAKMSSIGENYYYTNLNMNYDPMTKKGRNMPPIQTPYQNQNYGYHPQNLHFYPDFLNNKNQLESNQMLMRMNSASNKGDYYLPKNQEYFHMPYQNMNLSHSTPNLMSNPLSQQQQQQNIPLEMKNYNMPLEEESKKQKESVTQPLEKESIKGGPIDYSGVNHIFAAFYIKSMQKLKSEQASLNSNNNLSRENSKKNSSLNINNSNSINNFGNLNSSQKNFKKEISEFNNDLHSISQVSNNCNQYSNTEEKKQRGEKNNYNNSNNINNNLNVNPNYNPYSVANSLNNSFNNHCNNYNNNSNANSAGGNYKLKIFYLLKVPEKANTLKKNGITNNTNDNSNSNSMGPLATSINLNSLEDLKASNSEVKVKERQNYNSSNILNNSASKGESQCPEVLFTFNKVGTPDLKNKHSNNPNNNNLSSSPNSNNNSFSGNKDNNPDENLKANCNLINKNENDEKPSRKGSANTNLINNENENTEPKNIENSNSKSSSDSKNKNGSFDEQRKKKEENKNLNPSPDTKENKASDKDKEANAFNNNENTSTNEKLQKENENTKINLSNHPIKSLSYPNSFGLVDLPTNLQLKQVDDLLKKVKENK